MRRTGQLDVRHFHKTPDVLEQLEDYFDLHIERWEATPTPSKFNEPSARELFTERTRVLGNEGWLRFSRLDWNGRPIALDWGTCYRGRYKYRKAKPTRLIWNVIHPEPYCYAMCSSLQSRRAPTPLISDSEDEPYKYRYATDVVQLQTWGLYPSSDKNEG